MTNIALAIKSFPEIKENIKEIFVMGGSYKGENDFKAVFQNNVINFVICDLTARGNILPAVEFNFYKDPEAVYIVFHSNIHPITVLTVDVDEYLNITLV